MNIIKPTSMFDLSQEIHGGGVGVGVFLIDICRLPMPAMV